MKSIGKSAVPVKPAAIVPNVRHITIGPREAILLAILSQRPEPTPDEVKAACKSLKIEQE